MGELWEKIRRFYEGPVVPVAHGWGLTIIPLGVGGGLEEVRSIVPKDRRFLQDKKLYAELFRRKVAWITVPGMADALVVHLKEGLSDPSAIKRRLGELGYITPLIAMGIEHSFITEDYLKRLVKKALKKAGNLDEAAEWVLSRIPSYRSIRTERGEVRIYAPIGLPLGKVFREFILGADSMERVADKGILRGIIALDAARNVAYQVLSQDVEFFKRLAEENPSNIIMKIAAAEAPLVRKLLSEGERIYQGYLHLGSLSTGVLELIRPEVYVPYQLEELKEDIMAYNNALVEKGEKLVRGLRE